MSQPTYIDEYTQPVNLHPRTTGLLIIDMQSASGSASVDDGRRLL